MTILSTIFKYLKPKNLKVNRNAVRTKRDRYAGKPAIRRTQPTNAMRLVYAKSLCLMTLHPSNHVKKSVSVICVKEMVTT